MLQAAHQLKVAADPVLALALSAILLAMAADKVKPPLFASLSAGRLAAQLLQVGLKLQQTAQSLRSRRGRINALHTWPTVLITAV